MMALSSLLIFSIVFLLLQANGGETPAEAYWKSKLGNSTPMPKVVKDGLMVNGARVYAQGLHKDSSHSTNDRKYNPNGAQVYTQGLSDSRNNNKHYKPNGAQVYAQGQSQPSSSSKNYKPNDAQVYLQDLSKIGSNTNYKPNGAQVYAQDLPSAMRDNKNYKPNGAQVYDQGLSEKMDGNKKIKPNGAQVYEQGFSDSRSNKQFKPNGAQVYAKGLSDLKSNKNFKPNGAQVYAQGLSKTTTNKKVKPNGAQVYAKKHSTSDTNRLTDKSVLFFFEKELTHPKGKMMIRFITSDEEAKFLPIKVSKSIPFSSNKLQEILNLFSVQPGTTNAKIAEETITLCEAKAIKGEQKSCATSLEDMVDFAVAHVGNNVKVLSTEVNKEALVEYKVESANKIRNDRNVVCHKMGYPYAVFYCHTSEKTDAYIVSLMDANGKKLNAVAVCHKDTSSWSPNHMAFQVLNVKPGSVPICHFINEDTIMWVPK